MADEVWALDHSTTWQRPTVERTEPVIAAARAVVDSYRAEPSAPHARALWQAAHERLVRELERVLRSVGR